MAWTRDELVLAFALYCRTPFGRLHQQNPEIVALADAIGRTHGALAMKLSNFASLDPAEQARGIRGLSGASALDREVFETFARRQDSLLDESERAASRLQLPSSIVLPGEGDRSLFNETEPIQFSGPTEVERTVMARRAQYAFRTAVLASYESTCAVCAMRIGALLTASHIIPWKVDESRRADPTNGLALCALHDRAFDRGLIGVDDNARTMISSRVLGDDAPPLHRVGLIEIAGQELRRPRRFHPDPSALAYHRQHVFAA
jgi:hypothetical protein